MAKKFYTLDEVAQLFRVSRRTLQDFLRLHPYYRRLGRRKLFTEDDITRLYEALPCPSSSTASAEAQTGTLEVRSPAKLLMRARELLTDQRRKRSSLDEHQNASKSLRTAEKPLQSS